MRRLFLLAPICILLFTATSASAQSRRQPFRLQLTPVDAKTLQPRSTFVLGEAVVVRFSLTNQSRVARKITVLPDTTIRYKLHSTEPYEYAPDVLEGYVGGTGWARTEGNMTVWGSYPPRMMTIAPGQTVSRTVDVSARYGYPLGEGTHTLTANYNKDVHATTSFRVVVDEEKTVPLLEKLAATPVQDGRDTVQRWAKATLNLVRKPSISGRVVDSEGHPLNEISIYITGALDANTETRKNGGYIVELLSPGSTYTITPQIQGYRRPGDSDYTLEPASRTITVQNGKITDVNFVATRIRVEKNYASEDEGAKATVSSIRDWMFEPERAIDGYRMVPVGEGKPNYWNDGTPNKFPDWLEVDFGVTRKIDWINVFTLPDNLKDPPDPDRNEKFSLHGITDFDVEYWTGRAWRTVPGGAIRGNRNVWRQISFPELVTNKIRVVVLNALGGETRITEIEAVHLNHLPEAKLAVAGQRNATKTAKATGHADSPLHFLIDGFDRDGKIQHYELNFGDGSQNYEWTFNPQKLGDKPQRKHSHVFTRAGTYSVTLTVVDDSEEATEATIVVTIDYPPEENRK